MTSSQHPTLSAVLGKAKVGGLVLAATVLVAGTAEAATGGDLFTQDTTAAQSAAESADGRRPRRLPHRRAGHRPLDRPFD